LKLRVSAISCLRQSNSLPSLVGGPHSYRVFYIALLPLPGSTSQQNYYGRPVASEVYAVTGPEIQPVFEYALPNRFYIRSVALFQASKRGGDFGTNYRFE
jgi:hypothetical protein